MKTATFIEIFCLFFQSTLSDQHSFTKVLQNLKNVMYANWLSTRYPKVLLYIRSKLLHIRSNKETQVQKKRPHLSQHTISEVLRFFSEVDFVTFTSLVTKQHQKFLRSTSQKIWRILKISQVDNKRHDSKKTHRHLIKIPENARKPPQRGKLEKSKLWSQKWQIWPNFAVKISNFVSFWTVYEISRKSKYRFNFML